MLEHAHGKQRSESRKCLVYSPAFLEKQGIQLWSASDCVHVCSEEKVVSKCEVWTLSVVYCRVLSKCEVWDT